MADILTTLNISGSGLAAQRVRLQTVAANMANARTTRTPEGGPYQRRAPVFEAKEVDPFGDTFDRSLSEVAVTEIHVEESAGRLVHDPGHPDADADGFVAYPEINLLNEMVDMMTTNRAYEANANVVDVTRDIALRGLEIGK